MKLFADLYLDENASVVIAKILASSGFDTLTALDASMLNKTDFEQLQFAAAVNRCLVTHNRIDFEALHTDFLTTHRNHHGIIIANQRKDHELARRISVLLNKISGDEFINSLLYF